MTQKAPKAPRAKRTAPDRRRELILEEACRQCMQSDRPGISFVEIARKLGVARSLVYHYFPNQEALMTALAEKRILGFVTEAEIPAEGTPEERLTALFTKLSDYLAEVPDYVAELIRTRRGRAVLDAASEDKVPLFIRLAKSCFDRPLTDKDDEVFYALSMFVRFLLTRNCRQPREERLKWVRIAVKTALAAAEATKGSDLTEVTHE